METSFKSSLNASRASGTRNIGLLIGALVLLAALWSSIVTIGPGNRGVLMTFGAVHPGVLNPGLHFKLPFVQTVKQMNVQIQKSQTNETAASRDLQNVSTEVAVNWAINPLDAEWVYQHLGDESELASKVIAPVVSNAVKAVAARYNAEDLIESRDKVATEIQQQIITALNQYKVQVQGVNITNFQFSHVYTEAIEQKQVAQQRALQATYDLQRTKIQAEQEVAQAEGQAQAQKLLQQTITPQIIQLKAVEKWNGVLPQVMGGNGAIPMIGPVTPAGKGGAVAD
ncbi:prohibitin family protein [Rhodanobacter aciditrophus]|uniref:prohibitin family protein n=1 Tax=Rhodanobacter aciditrophus TaxID=1623218 RepID=UPI003CF80BAC